MVEGESGLLAIYPNGEGPTYEPSKRRITWPDGAIATLYSADEPERLRGPQHTAAWCDEIAAWKYPEALDQLNFGLRLGDDPRKIITTTPKPVKLVRDLISDPTTFVTRGSTYDNRANLAPAFFDEIIKKYEGTRLGRQELNAEILDDLPGALWTRALIEASRRDIATMPALVRVVVAIDPAVTASEDSDETGIGVVGLDRNGHCWVLEDVSLRASPLQWASQAIKLLLKWRGDRIVGEVNNGGDLVEGNIRAVEPNCPFRQVRASRGKATRAEPVAAMYEQGRVHHVIGTDLTLLEDQLCTWVPGSGMRSPDRMDWLVWAITDLVVDPADVTVRMTDEYRYEISPY